MPYQYETATPADLDSLVSIITFAFAGGGDGVREWVEKKVTIPQFRVMRSGREPAVACAALLPMGQFYGGKSVTMLGIAGVGVLPHVRGKGLATEMMTRVIREGAAAGYAISSLYPSTTALYRSVGYEQAGQHNEHSFPVTRLPGRLGETGYRVRPITSADLPAVYACYTQVHTWCDGALDRGRYIWERKESPRGQHADGYVVAAHPERSGADVIDGYVYLRQERASLSGRHSLEVADMTAATPGAARELLAFLSGFSSMADTLTFRAGVAHPLATLLAESRFLEVAARDTWMLRVLNVENMLAQRGYHAGLTTQLSLRISDAILANNNGDFHLEISDGCATVQRGTLGGPGLDPARTAPDIITDIRGLAQLFAGQFPPTVLHQLGRLVLASPSAGQRAHAAFSGNGGFCDFF